MTERSSLDLAKAELPAPPEGFDWAMFQNVVFLQPAHWHVVTKEVPTPAASQAGDIYATSPVRFSETNPFDTGLTLEVLSGMKAPNWVSARHAFTNYLYGYLCLVKNEGILIFSEKQRQGLDTVVVRFRDTRFGLPPEIVHKFAMIHHELEVVQVLTFETPESLWAEHWERYGTPILSCLSMVGARHFATDVGLP